jgi:CPA2 family monovalent cation:H+ antiporter-2
MKLGLSGIPLYIGAGILFGPNDAPPFPIVIEPNDGIALLAEIGVIMLLFYLGLEFSLERLTQARRLVVVGGTVDLVVSAGLGLGVGFLILGFTLEAVIVAGLIYISSSGIITRALFDFRRLADDETDLILGILVFEDLAIALFLGVTAGLARGAEVSAASLTVTTLVSMGFVLAFLVASRYAHNLLDRLTPRLEREQVLIGSLAIVISAAALAEAAGLSEAIGALLAGVLLSGSEVRDVIEQALLGLRDFTAGIFFFSFGLAVDLAQVPDLWAWLALGIPVAILGKLAAGYGAGRVTRFSKRQSLNVGAALVARGEFTIILAGLAVGGVALDARFREQVGPFAGLFVLATAVIGVVLMRESPRAGRILFRKRPPPDAPRT